MEVAGEERYLADVLSTDQARDEAFQADGEATMRRHAVLEGLEIAAVRGGVG